MDRTATRHFLPFGGQGLSSELTAAADVSGTCSAESLAVPLRPDAWDCIDDGDQSYEPCFENQCASDDAAVELACVGAPYENELVLLTVDDPLPRDKAAPPGATPPTVAPAASLASAPGTGTAHNSTNH